MKIHIALIFCISNCLNFSEEVSVLSTNCSLTRPKRAPEVIKIVNFYRPTPRKKRKPVYGPPKPVYGPSVTTFHGPPRSIHGSPKPHHFSKVSKIKYGVPFSKGLYKPSYTFDNIPWIFENPNEVLYQSSKHLFESTLNNHGSSHLHPSVSYELPVHVHHHPFHSDPNCLHHGTNPPVQRPTHVAPATRTPGYELPPPDSAAVPLDHDPTKATYGTPNAVNSYGEPLHHTSSASINYQSQYVPHSPSSWNDGILGSSSNVVKQFKPKTSTKRRRIKSRKTVDSEHKSPNHNYEGEGVQDDTTETSPVRKYTSSKSKIKRA